MSFSPAVPQGKHATKEEKKLKKRKRAEAVADEGANGDAHDAHVDEEAQRKLEKQEKREKKRAKKELNGQVEADAEATDAVTETKAERKARKAAKRAEKEQHAALTNQSEDVENETAPDTTAKADKKARKAAKKAAAQAAADVPLPNVQSSGGQYEQSDALSAAPETEVKAFLESKMIHVEAPSGQFRPIMEFSQLPTVIGGQNEFFKGFKEPTPIQAAAWPYLLAGQDVIGVAQTGSGKTLAFGLPCVRYVNANMSTKMPKIMAVVLSPTRELAQQIFEQYQKLASGIKVNMACLVGGMPKDDQRPLLKKANIVVATPGRLQDFIEEGAAELGSVGYLVLDEADRMLDTGFEQAIRKIISNMPREKQTLMFTATWPPSIRDLAATFMRNPVKISIGDNPTGELRANTRIKQEVEVVDPRAKEQRLLQLLKQHQSGKNKDDRILVFCLYKKEAVRVERFIASRGFRVSAIHGDMSQTQRNASFESFRSGKVPLLVATDVAARGLDIPAVKVVINVTFPLTVEDYVHRIGRTGRAGADGLSVTLFTEHDKAQSGALINVLRAANQPVPEELLKFGTTVKRKQHDAYGAFFRDSGAASEGPKQATKITFDD